MKQILSLTTLFVVFAMIVGCGGNPYGTVKVSGKVVYEDGSAWTAPNTTIHFISQQPNKDTKTYPREGTALLNDNGTFDGVTTYDFNDGVIKGPCKVYLSIAGIDQDLDPQKKDYQKQYDAKLKTFADTKYFSPENTPITMDITGGSIEIKVAK